MVWWRAARKEQLQARKRRSAGYIDKPLQVRQLEAHKSQPEGEAAVLRQQQAGPRRHGRAVRARGARCGKWCCAWARLRGLLRLEQEHLLEDIAHVRQRLDAGPGS